MESANDSGLHSLFAIYRCTCSVVVFSKYYIRSLFPNYPRNQFLESSGEERDMRNHVTINVTVEDKSIRSDTTSSEEVTVNSRAYLIYQKTGQIETTFATHFVAGEESERKNEREVQCLHIIARVERMFH